MSFEGKLVDLVMGSSCLNREKLNMNIQPICYQDSFISYILVTEKIKIYLKSFTLEYGIVRSVLEHKCCHIWVKVYVSGRGSDVALACVYIDNNERQSNTPLTFNNLIWLMNVSWGDLTVLFPMCTDFNLFQIIISLLLSHFGMCCNFALAIYWEVKNSRWVLRVNW